MYKYSLIAIAVTGIAILGATLETQSQLPTRELITNDRSVLIFCPGRIEGKHEELYLNPQQGGQVVHVAVQAGQWVEAGQLLVELDDRQFQHELELAEARRRVAQAHLDRLLNGAHEKDILEAQGYYESALAQLEQAQLAWKRVQSLRADNVATAKEADDQRTKVDALKANVAAAQAKLERLKAPARADEVAAAQAEIAAADAQTSLAQVRLDRCKLKAPTAGQILEVHAIEGELSGPSNTSAAVVMADTSALRVRAFVEEMDAPRVQPGMVAQVTADGLPGVILAGRVTQLSPRMSSKELFSDDPGEVYDTKVREVWIAVESHPNLVIGLRVDVILDPSSTPSTSSDEATSNSAAAPALDAQTNWVKP